MKRRQFLQATVSTFAATYADDMVFGNLVQSAAAAEASSSLSSAAAFTAARRFAELACGRIAYVDHGSGDVALFLHGAPLNSFQWRGSIDLLSPYRRCVALDFMGLGYSQVPQQQSLAADAQLAMLVALLDKLGIAKVDIIASDSGGAVAQLLVARYPQRVRSLLLTNCDVEPDSPPAGVQPAIAMARAGTLADATGQWLTDRALARATFGAAVYHNPADLADETIDYYVRPLVSSALRRAQYHDFHLALEPNPLAGIEAALKRSAVPVKMVWGGSDTIFSVADAEYLDRIFPRSRGIRLVPEGKLFFPEEFPDIIADEARRLWQSV
ncbi:alpha/beta fold hydrolase [Undibacterium sp. TJN19]|uniref:alpha/beta fold hydrolase n=1 Tax=Undibacterium sp. TJN19 TaxID=3413055 RepID=UPI003BEFC6B2